MGQAISGTFPNLVNGVSQQPDALRLPTQSDVQINGYSTIVSGLIKRPPTIHVASLGSAQSDSNAFLHTINRDNSERYIVMITNGRLRVFDIQGNEKQVNAPSGFGYLTATGKIRDSIQAVTIADYTVILNKTRVVQMRGDVSPARPQEALIYVKAGNYGRTYRVNVAGHQVAAYLTPDGGTAAHTSLVDTTYIAERITAGIRGVFDSWNSNGTFGGGWDLVRIGHCIYIVNYRGYNFQISTADGYGGNAMTAIKNTVQKFSDLPSTAHDGFLIEVAGDQNTGFGNYYVRFKAQSAGDSTGVWAETVKPGTQLGFNAATMPHILIREANGTFTFKPASWDDRTVGDVQGTPEPSFVGRPINDVFFHRNRLGLLSDENVIFSRAGDFFNFWPKTMTSVVDDDPIDVAASHIKVSILKHAIPSDSDLMLFSDQTQFILTADSLLTPKNVTITPLSEYEMDTTAAPVGAGMSVFFTVKQGAHTSMREYAIDLNTEIKTAIDATGHIPQYIPADVFKMVASSNLDVCMLLSDQAPDKAYVYKYYYAGQEKLQSSWSCWEFGEDVQILNADFIDTNLYIIVKRGNELFIEYLPMEAGHRTISGGSTIHLDRLIHSSKATRTYNISEGYTYFTFKAPVITTPYVVVTAAACDIEGVPLSAGVDVMTEVIDAYTYRIAGDLRNHSFWSGIPYTFRYRLPKALLREQGNNGGSVVVTTGRLQLLRMAVAYDDTGYFEALVSSKARDTRRYEFTGRIQDDPANVMDAPALSSGQFRFPVGVRNTDAIIDIVSDSFLPLALLSATWEGFYNTHTKRV